MNYSRFIELGIKSGKFIITDLGLERRCSVCRDYWPCDDEFFFSDKSTKMGLTSHCRCCEMERKAQNKIGGKRKKLTSNWERLFNN